MYCPESGGRTFEENQDFFKEAASKGNWGVRKVKKANDCICWIRRRTKMVRARRY